VGEIVVAGNGDERVVGNVDRRLVVGLREQQGVTSGVRVAETRTVDLMQDGERCIRDTVHNGVGAVEPSLHVTVSATGDKPEAEQENREYDKREGFHASKLQKFILYTILCQESKLSGTVLRHRLTVDNSTINVDNFCLLLITSAYCR